MTISTIKEILERMGEDTIVSDFYVMTISNRKRELIFCLNEHTDLDVWLLNVFYADKHSDELYDGEVATKSELEKIIKEKLREANEAEKTKGEYNGSSTL